MSDTPTRYVAQQYVAGTPQAEVTGAAVQAFSSNLEAEMMAELLPKHGFGDIDPEAWYPHQNWMDLLQDIEARHGSGASNIFVAFGREVVATAVMPPEMQTIEDVLHSLHAIHHANLRHIPEEEGYRAVKKGERHYWVYENTPNPSDVIYGFLWGLMARFKDPGEMFVVRPIDNPNPAEEPGTLFEIKWGRRAEDLK